VIVCTVTGSTHAGMVVGFAADGARAQRHRHRCLLHPGADQAQVLDHREKTSDLVIGRPITADDIVLKREYAYPVYGVPFEGNGRGDPPVSSVGGHDHRPSIRGKSMQADRPGAERLLFPRVEVALRPSRRCACAQRLQRHVSQWLKCRLMTWRLSVLALWGAPRSTRPLAEGFRVIGFDRLEPGHDRSSSFGERPRHTMAYFEHPSYVPLLRGAYRAWRDLEVATARES